MFTVNKCLTCGAQIPSYSTYCSNYCAGVSKKDDRHKDSLGGGHNGKRESGGRSPWKSISPFHSKFGW